MRISIFTPTHRPDHLLDAWESIRDQDFHEWVIALNGKATLPTDFIADPRVRILTVPKRFHMVDDEPVDTTHWIGYLKSWACDQCTGDVLFELDHDDLLTPTAIAEVRAAFEDNPEVGFVYSNTVHCDMAFNKIERFQECWGWRYRETDFTWRGTTYRLDEHLHFDPTPNCVSRIWYAPNHLRAFRASSYREMGGYNIEMRVLDDLDLMCRMYAVTRFHHIDKGLYVYRYGNNTFAQSDINAEIQNNVYRIHDQYIESLAEKWSRDNNLDLIELGGRMNAKPGYQTVDLCDADWTWDLNNTPWPFADGSVGVIRAMDVLEHLDPKKVLDIWSEIYRVLAPGGYAFIQVPSTDGRGAFQDPTHSAGTFYNENSFYYYTRQEFQNYMPKGFRVRFQEMRLYTTEKNAMQVCWVIAHLVKLTDGVRVPGLVLI